MEGGRLKRSPQLVEGKDYVMVPEPVWRALYHWYGANLSLPRPVSCDFRHFLTTGFVLWHKVTSYSHLPLHPVSWRANREKAASRVALDGKLWLFSRRFAAQARGISWQGRSAAQLLVFAKAHKSKPEVSLKGLASKHSSLKPERKLKSYRMKSGTPAALKTCSCSLTIPWRGRKATIAASHSASQKHNVQNWGKSSKADGNRWVQGREQARTVLCQNGWQSSGAPGSWSCRNLLTWKHWELFLQFLLSVFIPQGGWFVLCQVVSCRRCT